jgi:hypothetical protein
MADVKNSVLFTVGTVGAKASAANMAALAAKVAIVATGVALLVGKFKEMADSAAEFQQVVDRVNVKMGAFNVQTAGMVDTMNSYQQAAKLQEAGLRVTEKQFAALGVAATKAAQAAGEGPEGADRRFNKLIKSIIKGSEGPMLEYGIQLDETTDKVKAQAEALEKFADKFGDVTVEAETAKEKLNEFNNTLGTVIDFRVARGTEAFSEFAASIIGTTETMSQWEQDLVATKGELADYYSLVEDSTVIEMAHDEQLWETIQTMDSYDDMRQRLIDSGEEGAAQLLDEALAYKQLTADIKMAAQWAATYGQLASGSAKTIAEAAAKAGASGLEGVINAAKELAPPREPARVVSKIRPRRKKDLLDAPIGRRRTGIGATEGAEAGGLPFGEDIDPLMSVISKTERERLEEAREEAVEEQKKLNKELEELYIEDAKNREKAQDMALSSTIDTFGNIAKAIGTSSEAAFNAQKAFLIPVAIMEGTMAAIAGFRSVMQTVPFPANVILAPTYAASIAAATGAQVANIASQKYGGGSKGASPSASALSAGSVGRSESGGELNLTTNVIVDGNVIQKSVYRANRRAAQNNQPAFAMN